MGIVVKVESYCLCCKNIRGIKMDMLSETLNLTLNIVNVVMRCPVCKATHSISVKLLYTDIHKGVKLL